MVSACATCGGAPIECGVCNAVIDGECERKDAISESCTDGGRYCKFCDRFAHSRCWDSYTRACKECTEDGGDDGLQRDDERERVKDMNAMLRCGRFYR